MVEKSKCPKCNKQNLGYGQQGYWCLSCGFEIGHGLKKIWEIIKHREGK